MGLGGEMESIEFVGDGVKEPTEALRQFMVKITEQIKSSEIFLTLFTQNYANSPLCLFQLAMAISLDKPIYLLIEEGIMPSTKIMKIIDGWEFFKRNDDADIKRAGKVLFQMAEEKGHLSKEKK